MSGATNRTASGPFVRTPVRPLNVRRQDCFRVLMRQMKPGANHGRWEPISTSGFVVVCPSRLEASECVWLVGGRYHPRPEWMVTNSREDGDFRYLSWLLQHHFRIEPYTKGSDPMEVWFSDFIRGWYPDAQDVLRASRVAGLVTSALHVRWGDR